MVKIYENKDITPKSTMKIKMLFYNKQVNY